jgi:hypothetical protein
MKRLNNHRYLNKPILLLTGLLLILGAQAQNKKDSLEIAKKARFDQAAEVLKTKTFGIIPDNDKIAYDYKNFMGFEDHKLILQNVFAGARQRFICEVSNYIYTTDKKGNVIVNFDYTGRVVSGHFTIEMKKGDNYAEITRLLRFDLNSSGAYPILLYGEILPSGECDYMEITGEL